MKAINEGIDEKLFTHIDESMKETSYYNLLGIELQKIGPGYTELIIETGSNHSNPLGMIHGGLIMSLADAAMANAIRSLGVKGVTVDCSVALPGAAQMGKTLTARGEVIKPGRNLLFAVASVYVEDKLIGNSKATFYKIGDIEY